MKSYIKQHWPQLVLVGLVGALLLWAGGCPPRTPSPLDPSRHLTLAELNVELEHILARFQLAETDIHEQQRIRTLIMENALLIANAGTVNPLGILTAIAGAYGVASVGKDTVVAVKKRKKPPA